MATSLRSVPRPVVGFLLAMVPALAAACVGGPGSLPDQVVGPEGASRGTSSSQGGAASGDEDDRDEDDPVRPPTPTPIPIPAPTNSDPSDPRCVEGAPCECGAAKFVGTYKCVEGKPTCNCVPAP